MPYFLITPDRYKTLEADAIASKQVSSWVRNPDDLSGVITTPDVTLSYQYDPTTNKLTYEIGARHSLAAHMASDNIIANHITKMLSSIPASSPGPEQIKVIPPPAGESVVDGVFVKSSGIDGDAGDWTKTEGEGVTDNTNTAQTTGLKVKAPIPIEPAPQS